MRRAPEIEVPQLSGFGGRGLCGLQIPHAERPVADAEEFEVVRNEKDRAAAGGFIPEKLRDAGHVGAVKP